MVCARLHGVRLAGTASSNVSVISTGRHTGLGEPTPSTRWLTTIAAIGTTASNTRAARVGVLSGEHGLSIAGGNAVSVIECLGTAECPAGAAVTLVTDTASDGRALGPSSANIETLRNSGGGEHGLHVLRLIVALLSGQHSSEKHLDIGNSGVGESGADLSFPSGLLGLK